LAIIIIVSVILIRKRMNKDKVASIDVTNNEIKPKENIENQIDEGKDFIDDPK